MLISQCRSPLISQVDSNPECLVLGVVSDENTARTQPIESGERFSRLLQKHTRDHRQRITWSVFDHCVYDAVNGAIDLKGQFVIDKWNLQDFDCAPIGVTRRI